MMNSDIESLRSFAIANNEVSFAHLCTAALGGERWAVDRIDSVMREWCFAPCDEDAVIAMMEDTDTTRPDGAVARRIEIVEVAS